MTFKNSVEPMILRFLPKVEKAYNSLGYPLVVTSILDGKHMVGSLHGKGRAVDCRTSNVPRSEWKSVRDAVKAALGVDFDVKLEKTHLHVEFDPKGGRKS